MFCQFPELLITEESIIIIVMFGEELFRHFEEDVGDAFDGHYHRTLVPLSSLVRRHNSTTKNVPHARGACANNSLGK